MIGLHVRMHFYVQSVCRVEHMTSHDYIRMCYNIIIYMLGVGEASVSKPLWHPASKGLLQCGTWGYFWSHTFDYTFSVVCNQNQSLSGLNNQYSYTSCKN